MRGLMNQPTSPQYFEKRVSLIKDSTVQHLDKKNPRGQSLHSFCKKKRWCFTIY